MEYNSIFYIALQKWSYIPFFTELFLITRMIQRAILPQARYSLSQFRALCITGPRQSGKTTLSRYLFADKPYLSFENPSVQFEAEQNPEAFLAQYKTGAILDEVQRIPHLFRYLQGILDSNAQRGQFVLTGSNNFLLQEQVSQSLAGRAGYLSLLPLSYAELLAANLAQETVQQHILTGGYPEIWNENLSVTTWMNSYVQTYVQRDVRLLRNISNLAAFTRFLYLCANYAGQILNRDDLARKTGVDTKTILAWLGLLENSYVVFLLQPWYNNLNKRLVKSPKLYFYDTGLLCFLLGLKTESGLAQHTAYGAIFENWVLAEIRKNGFNAGGPDGMYYFRDAVGNEVDLILERESEPVAIEIKSGSVLSNSMFRGLNYWQKLQPRSPGILLHGGSTNELVQEQLSVIPWTEVANL
jgi:predicted AAA+ superfamily ATPase